MQVRTPITKNPSAPKAKKTGYGSKTIKTPSTNMSSSKGHCRGAGAADRGCDYTDC